MNRSTAGRDEVFALDARDLVKTFGGVQALKGVSLRVRPGEVVCLVGENGCGKSTFVKIVSGVHAPDAGTVTVDGERLATHHPRAAIAAGVQVIYQDLSLFDHLSVAENIALNRLLHDGSRTVRRARMREIAAEQLARVGVDLDLDAPVSAISVANRQVVAICRALTMNAKVLFMDEPTTALTTKEVKRLLGIVTHLRARGLAIVFISHKLDEVMDVADRVTVFRDGMTVGEFAGNNTDEKQIAYHMTGREVTHERYERRHLDDSPVLEVDHLSRAGNYQDVSLTVRRGDIVGLTGLLGSGRTELALSLFGLNPPDSGMIRVDGTPTRITSPVQAMELGVALVPESRQTQGLFLNYSVARNTSAPRLDAVTGGGRLLSKRRERRLADDVIARMGVNNRDPETIVGNLSGGNQQKVVIGRGLTSYPKVYVLDSPTVGVDIGAKSDIYARIQDMAHAGMGVLLISDEPEEIAANCNRVAVMHDGRVIATFEAGDIAHTDFKKRLAALIADPDGVEAHPYVSNGTQPRTEARL